MLTLVKHNNNSCLKSVKKQKPLELVNPNLIVVLVILTIISIGCKTESPSEPTSNMNPPSSPDSFQYDRPDSLGDGWETAYLKDVGLDENILLEMLSYLKSQKHRIHSIIIVKNGKLVFEEYFKGYKYDRFHPGKDGEIINYTPTTKHFEASVTKSITSAIFGVAYKEGYFNNMNTKIADFYPEYSSTFKGQKLDMTIEHFITMTAGLAWDENTYPYGDSRNDVTVLFSSKDPIKFILSKTLVTVPGKRFFYNSGYPNILADLIEKETSDNIGEFAKKKLFNPLGITNFFWEQFSSGYYFASGGIYLTPRDLAKIGYLFINNGYWKGQQLITGEWIEKSRTKYIPLSNRGNTTGYGYYWWLNSTNVSGKTIDYFYAGGWGEQTMFLQPDNDLLVAINCGYYLTPITVSPYYLLHKYILESLQ